MSVEFVILFAVYKYRGIRIKPVLLCILFHGNLGMHHIVRRQIAVLMLALSIPNYHDLENI